MKPEKAYPKELKTHPDGEISKPPKSMIILEIAFLLLVK